jgi:hypothetical protein
MNSKNDGDKPTGVCPNGGNVQGRSMKDQEWWDS